MALEYNYQSNVWEVNTTLYNVGVISRILLPDLVLGA